MKKFKKTIQIYSFISIVIMIGSVLLAYKFPGHFYNLLGDYVGGVLGTLVSIITLIVVYLSFQQVSEQSIQNTIAILLQSYQHTVEDLDIIINKKVVVGREAIKESLNDFLIIYKDEDYNFEGEKTKKYLLDSFPTHIPSIILSILDAIDSSESKNKARLYKQIRLMLSYEERRLLLLYFAEQITNSIENEEWNIVNEAIFEDGKSISLKNKEYFELYNKIKEWQIKRLKLKT
jgi:hypothetical protein